jgi:hypothetical protein
MLRHRPGEFAMPDPDTAALLRSILDELCADEPGFAATSKIDVASRLLEAVKQGRSSIDDLKAAGRQGLHQTPTMWR